MRRIRWSLSGNLASIPKFDVGDDAAWANTLVLVLFALPNLAADLTSREIHGVHIGIGCIGGERCHERVKAAGGHVLFCHGDDTRRRPGAGNSSASQRASWGPRRAVT